MAVPTGFTSLSTSFDVPKIFKMTGFNIVLAKSLLKIYKCEKSGISLQPIARLIFMCHSYH